MSEGLTLEYELIRSRRRTVSITVGADGRVVVRAPQRLARRDIDAMVGEKRRWIEEKLALVRHRAQLHPRREAASGEQLLYLGQPLLLVFSDHIRRPERLQNTLALPKALQAKADRAVQAWYRQEALEYLRSRVEHFSRVYAIPYASVGVTAARRRWGSCSAAGSINFAWRLILCPPEVIDYVVVHELCHVRHLNHSAAFWAQVGGILPDYRRQIQWLKDNSAILSLY